MVVLKTLCLWSVGSIPTRPLFLDTNSVKIIKEDREGVSDPPSFK